MDTPKPIKRNAAIVEFSKDHHFALLLIWKIREGLRKSVEPSRINKYVIHFFDTDLIHHFKDEEELLFTKLPADNKLRIQAEQEHRTIRHMISDLRTHTDAAQLPEKFADILEKHIRFEERELFNHLQENLPDNLLADIASSLKSRSHEPDSLWNDRFWENKTPEV